MEGGRCVLCGGRGGRVVLRMRGKIASDVMVFDQWTFFVVSRIDGLSV